jgi:integrase
LALGGELWNIIERQLRARGFERSDKTLSSSGFVFHSGGAPIGDIRKAWATACKKAGVAGRLFHDLRRTLIRNAIRGGVPERVAMAMSGHKTRAVFDRYYIVNEDDLRQAAIKTQQYTATQSKAQDPRPVIESDNLEAVQSIIQ